MSARPRTSPQIVRAAHGNGVGALLRAEAPPLDEIPAPTADDTARAAAVAAKRGRPFERGNRAGSSRKPIIATLAIPTDKADPRWAKALRKARRYTDKRRRELAHHCGGYLGMGPSAMLAAAGRALAASVLLYELAGETLDPALYAQAANLGDKARQMELTAVGLAEREAEARRGGDSMALDRLLGPGEEASRGR